MSAKQDPYLVRRRALRAAVEEVVSKLTTDPEISASITLPTSDTACLHDVGELPRSLQPKFLQYLTAWTHRTELLSPHRTFTTPLGELSLQELHAELDRLNGFSGK